MTSFPADMSAHLTNDIITNDKTSTEAITIIPHEVNNATTEQGIDVTYPTITIVHTILQYDWVDNTKYYKSYKKRRFIDGAIHILVAPHMMALKKKADTLTQSQMLKDTEADKFV
jgi:hypothetical protein